MKLSISNIAWADESDTYIYQHLKERRFEGLEIAPSRIIKNEPYDSIELANELSKKLKVEYNLNISSMQSIWYGRTENIFTSEVCRNILLEYTQKAICFAESIGCGNLVFGCPRNRNMPDNMEVSVVYDFFKQLGDYAFKHNTILAIEANPKIYNTNFINTTKEAIELVRNIGSKGLMVNYDLGTCICNDEGLNILEENLDYVNHIHISEPYLERIERRRIHWDLADILKKKDYKKYISIEMKKQDSIDNILQILDYVREVYQ